MPVYCCGVAVALLPHYRCIAAIWEPRKNTCFFIIFEMKPWLGPGVRVPARLAPASRSAARLGPGSGARPGLGLGPGARPSLGPGPGPGLGLGPGLGPRPRLGPGSRPGFERVRRGIALRLGWVQPERSHLNPCLVLGHSLLARTRLGRLAQLPNTPCSASAMGWLDSFR